MEKRSYIKQISVWWECLDTEADNQRINPALFRPPVENNSKNGYEFKSIRKSELGLNPDIGSSSKAENCFIIKEAIQKLHQFLSASHQDGCSDRNCTYNSKLYKLKLRLKRVKDSSGLPTEFRIHKKRGRKSKLELQQMAMLRSGNMSG
ncbi:hypothetical protein SteCoe_8301 [Stentor coeruleus]|uniref:Uncharacterized protein n=1 Tax=Stentor coeruleus TaxID=5963 RepID=A0A1R2CKL4_9CILI|nr:hypothetical protein SteCoe_8301 [Stentor coeruleus]